VEKILLVCDNDAEIRATIETIVKEKGLFELVHQNVESAVRSTFFQSNQVKGILFDCKILGRNELALTLKLNQLSGQAPILVTADQISLYSYRKVDIFKNMIAIQKPIEEIVCLSLLQKMISSENFCVSPCPRFITDESVSLVHLKSGLMIPTRMRNYSFGGAFLEYKGMAVKTGDTVNMNISRGRGENLQVTAKVVWTRNGENSGSPLRGIGVQFKSIAA
jgi:hypothetical protein